MSFTGSALSFSITTHLHILFRECLILYFYVCSLFPVNVFKVYGKCTFIFKFVIINLSDIYYLFAELSQLDLFTLLSVNEEWFLMI